MSMCGGACTNLSSDAANCGACAQACANGQSCQSGQCTGTVQLNACGGLALCIAMCPAGNMACAAGCMSGATANANTLFSALSACVSQSCPSAQQTDPCNPQNPNYQTACPPCQSNAVQGACSAQYTACMADMP
jgi:hypothetical protein